MGAVFIRQYMVATVPVGGVLVDGAALDGLGVPGVLLGHGVDDRVHERAARELEADGEDGEDLEGGVALAALDAADVGPVEAGAGAEGLLADAEGAAPLADDRADGVHRLRPLREHDPRHVRHVGKLPGVTTLDPRTLVVIYGLG